MDRAVGANNTSKGSHVFCFPLVIEEVTVLVEEDEDAIEFDIGVGKKVSRLCPDDKIDTRLD